MSDLISRRQAIDVIDKEQKEIDVSDVSAMYAYSKCKTIIKQLPSALSTNLAEVGTDSISRQEAIDICDNVIDVFRGQFGAGVLVAIKESIEELPSAHPEIIRCRNCKFASGDSRICMKFDHSPIGELDFCAWAERRTDG